MSRSLRYFTSKQLVKARYKATHGGSVNTTKARSIAVHVEQGMNFLDAAAQAPVSIRPLLQFYGVAATSRAVVLFLSTDLHEQGLVAGHGLSFSPWSPRSPRAERDVSDVEVSVAAGLFSQLMEVANPFAVFRANSSRPNWQYAPDPVDRGVSLGFRDCLGLLPDLWPEYGAWTGTDPKRINLEKLGKDDESGLFDWRFGGAATPDECLQLFIGGSPEVKSDTPPVIRASSDATVQPVQLLSGAFDIGDTLFVPPLAEDVSLPPITVIYLVSYVMSMLARYHLSDWTAIWRGGSHDAARPLLEEAMNLIQKHFPQICAELMDDRIRAIRV